MACWKSLGSWARKAQIYLETESMQVKKLCVCAPVLWSFAQSLNLCFVPSGSLRLRVSHLCMTSWTTTTTAKQTRKRLRGGIEIRQEGNKLE